MATPVPIITEGAYVRVENTGAAYYTVELNSDASTSGIADPALVYEWKLVSSSRGDDTEVTLTDADAAVVVINDLVAGEAIRVMLVLTNADDESSVSTPYPVQATSSPYGFAAAPTTAFCDIAVALPNTGLVKSPPGARDWAARSHYPLVDEVEDLAGRVTAVEDSQVQPATNVSLGTVGLLLPAVSPALPMVPNAVFLSYSGQIVGDIAFEAGDVAPGDRSSAQMIWYAHADCKVFRCSGAVRNRGSFEVDSSDRITVNLLSMTPAQFTAEEYVYATTLGTLTWAYESNSRVATWTSSGDITIPAGNVVAARVIVAPTNEPASYMFVNLTTYTRM